MKPDIIVIGAGLSGLGAAVELAGMGISVLVLERRQHPGGRTYSFVDEKTGDVVDNGQHLMMGCYESTRRYLKTIGSENLASLQPNLHIDFVHPQRGAAALRCPSIPSPFHLLAGLMNLRTLSFADRLKLLQVGIEIHKSPELVEPALASLTVHQWLESMGQSEENKKYLWDIIAIGSLNDDPREVSAVLFYRILRAAFLGRRENSSLLIPRVGLSDLFVAPALEFLRSHGGEVRLGCGAEEMVFDAGLARSLRCENGSHLEAAAFVSAVPWYSAAALLPHGAGINRSADLDRLQPSPIVTINLWFDRIVMDAEFLALLDSRVQWVFNKTALYRSANASPQYLSLVISGAERFVAMSSDELVALAVEDLGRSLPRSRDAKLVHSLVVKEKRATFSPRPDSEEFRPSCETPVKNFFLAGDWTATGFPATIEGAILSGRKAAGCAGKFLGR